MPSFESQFESWFCSDPEGDHSLFSKNAAKLLYFRNEDVQNETILDILISRQDSSNEYSLDVEAFQQLRWSIDSQIWPKDLVNRENQFMRTVSQYQKDGFVKCCCFWGS